MKFECCACCYHSGKKYNGAGSHDDPCNIHQITVGPVSEDTEYTGPTPKFATVDADRHREEEIRQELNELRSILAHPGDPQVSIGGHPVKITENLSASFGNRFTITSLISSRAVFSGNLTEALEAWQRQTMYEYLKETK